MKNIKNTIAKTFSSLSIKNYRLYFFGQAVSQVGTWMQIIAQNWLVLKLTNSGTQLGLVAAAQFLPVLLFGPAAGILADRFDKRKIIIFTQACSGVLALILALLISFDAVKLWMIYCLATGIGLINSLDTPTRHTFIYEMVGSEKITNAISLNASLYNLSRIIGPAIAGIIIVSFGLAPCFYINAASFLAVILGIFCIDTSILKKQLPIEKIKGQLTEGFKYIMREPLLRDILIFMAIMGIFVYEFSVSVPLLAQITFHSGAQGYAALTSSMGIGSVFGGLFSASRKQPKISQVILAILFFGLAMFMAALSPNLIIAMISMVLIGFCSTNFSTRGNVLLQLNTTPQMRGRVLSLWNVAFVGSTPIGGPIIGYVSENLNPAGVLPLVA